MKARLLKKISLDRINGNLNPKPILLEQLALVFAQIKIKKIIECT
jgi:hypothetical protein